jgi:phosphinothricin acetyltransferase
MNMEIRNVTLNDAKAICDIYNYYIENTAVTFETQPVSVSEMQDRIRDAIDFGYPYYIGEANGRIIGYCYAHRWNNRCSYITTQEVSIYLDIQKTGKGYGSLFFEHLLQNADRKNVHTIIAGICIPNEGSVRLHEKFGFRQISHFKEIGKKFNQWRDVGHWQLILDN